jgi:hypothetical protein
MFRMQKRVVQGLILGALLALASPAQSFARMAEDSAVPGETKDVCRCVCVRTSEGGVPVGTIESSQTGGDDYFDDTNERYTSDQSACERRNGMKCQGYLAGKPATGTLKECTITAVPK